MNSLGRHVRINCYFDSSPSMAVLDHWWLILTIILPIDLYYAGPFNAEPFNPLIAKPLSEISIFHLRKF